MGVLDLPTIATNQNQKEQTSNDADAALEAAMCNNADIDLTSGNYTIPDDASPDETADDFKRNFSFTLQNATSAGREVTIPAVARYVLFVCDSSCTQNVDLKVGSTTLTISPSTKMLVRVDGTANGLEQMAFNSGPPNIGVSYQGMPGSGDILLAYVYVQVGSFPASLSGSRAKSDVAATSDSTFDVKKNGSSIGSIFFGAGQSTGVFSGAGGSFVAGDVLKIVAPNPQDATLADIAITLKGA